MVDNEDPWGADMNAVNIEQELMDPADYWRLHACGWHQQGDVAGYCHYPNLANFYYDLEEDAEWLLDQLGYSHN